MAEAYKDFPDASPALLRITKEIEATTQILRALWLADETPVIALGRHLYSEQLAALQVELAALWSSED